jgi:hypothetical protein
MSDFKQHSRLYPQLKRQISDSTAVSTRNANVISLLKADDRNKNQIPTAEYFLKLTVVHLIKILFALKENRIHIRPILFATVHHWSLSKIGKYSPVSTVRSTVKHSFSSTLIPYSHLHQGHSVRFHD